MSTNGKLLNGQQYDPRDLLTPIPFTQQMMEKEAADALIGQPRTEIMPVDAASSQVKMYDIDGVLEEIETFFIRMGGGYTSFNLPPTLTGITITSSKKEGEGDNITAPGVVQFAGTSGSGEFNINNSAQASSAINLAAVPVIVENRAENVDVDEYFFYMAPGSFTKVQLLTKLSGFAGATVNSWPKFRPKSIIFAMKSGQVAVQQNARTHSGVRYSSGSASGEYFPAPGERSDGYSVDYGLTTETVTIPPTLHAAITPTFTAETVTAAVAVEADTPPITSTLVSVIAINNHPTPVSRTFTTSIFPTSFAATTPTDIPKSGLYLKSVNAVADENGLTAVRCEVVDFSYFA